MLLWGVFAFSVFAAAEDEEHSAEYFQMSLEELMSIRMVDTPSRIEESVDLAPNTVYTYDRNDIQRRGMRTIGDVLLETPGFFANYRQHELVSSVRGLAPNGHNKITYRLNGHPLNNLTESSVLNGPVLMDIMESVEVVAGPGSVMYGTDTLAGSVNLKTRDVTGVEGTLRLGTSLSALSFVSGGKVTDDIHLKVSGTIMEMEGFDAWNDSNFPEFKGDKLLGKREDSYTFIVESSWKDFEFQYLRYKSKMHESSIDRVAALAGSSVRNGRRIDEINSLVLKHSKDLNDALTLGTKIWADFKELDRIPAHPPYFAGQDGWELNENTYGWEETIKWKKESHFIQAGIQGKIHEHVDNNRVSVNTSLDGLEKTQLIKNSHTWQLGGFLSDKWEFHDNYTLVGAARADHNTLLDNSKIYLSPRVALIRQSDDAHWISKLMYNKNTRMPDAWMSPQNEIFGKGNPRAPVWASQNPTAERPETLYSVEWQNIYYPTEDLRFSLNLYHQQLDDFISWMRPFTNVGDMEANGVELSTTWRVSRKVELRSWLSWVDTDWSLKAAGANPFNSAMTPDGKSVSFPQWMATFQAEFQPVDSLYITPTLRYFTEQPSRTATSPNVFNGSGTVSNRYYFDASLVYEDFPMKNMSLQLIGKNLLDNRDVVAVQWGGSAQYRPRGRELEAAITIRF